MSAVALGRLYRCPVCGAKVILIRASSAALDLVCCNVPMRTKGEPNPVYRCEVCGAEVAALKDKGGELDLVCCHEPMVRRDASAIAA
jgi:desulfoferrodoxin-like iron-binding protein